MASLFEDDVAKPTIAPPGGRQLAELDRLNTEFEDRYSEVFCVDTWLNRGVVSFQANKNRAVYRWFKYKEGFSAALAEGLLRQHCPDGGTVLDPFAGSGTTLFAGSALGMPAEGIELLPVGQIVIATRQLINSGITEGDIDRLAVWRDTRPWSACGERQELLELRITRGAYPPDTLAAIERYLAASDQENDRVRLALRFALLCILESVSYTRKDGQYLRWDHRAGRRQGKKVFDKGVILPFDKAIRDKLDQMITDILGDGLMPGVLFDPRSPQSIRLHSGSCLDILPGLPCDAFDCIVTSPPYCNRYDYTRTYALELAMLGVDEAELVRLRQAMLSCTVENRSKDLLSINPVWGSAITAADKQPLLHAILDYLEAQREANLLNNTGIPRMVRGYFYEMACVIAECARVLKRGAALLMVNDNVRYAGACVSVDIILSELAKRLGFEVEGILVLPSGKGNSSQQMGAHGRDALRKCVYVWRKG